MYNNVGVISTTLSKTIGTINNIPESVYITVISGEINIGSIVFDDDGTMAVCTEIVGTIGSGEAVYKFKTTVKNAEVDIDYLLTQPY